MIKPSDIVFQDDCMLPGLFKESGAEFAAVMIIKFCQEKGSWQNPVKIADFQGWISRTSILNSGNPEHWSQNVFFQPKLNMLIKLGVVNRLPGNDLHLLPAFFTELEKHYNRHLLQNASSSTLFSTETLYNQGKISTY